MNLYNEKSIKIIEPENIDTAKPFCVLGIYATEFGLFIKDKMLEWLGKNYNVFIVEQDVSGFFFEFPALRFMFDLVEKRKLNFCLYLHNKGAVNLRTTTLGTHILWKNEFIDNFSWYKEILTTSTPTVACPYTGKTKATWMNGFFINNSAVKKIVLEENFKDRFYYEHIFSQNPNFNSINVIGRLSNTVGEQPNEQEHIKMNDVLKKLTHENYPEAKDGQLIVSLTSYPGRIGCVVHVLNSIFKQNVDREKYHVVVVLAKEQFKNQESDLPQDLLNVIFKNGCEIIWTEKDIKSHKKLMPTLKKYPNNPILVCDDDIMRKQGWLEMFLIDHEKYPNDVIGGVFVWKLNKRFNQVNIGSGVKCKHGYQVDEPYKVITTERYANGLGGVLYPVGTFKDPRFFNEDLMLKLCPTSDESWQYCFNIIEGRTIRQSSKIFIYDDLEIKGSQKTDRVLGKINNYNKIYRDLFNAFPEYKIKMENMLNINPEIKNNIICYRTYFKDEQLKKCTQYVNGVEIIPINTNSKEYPFSNQLNKYWSEYALMVEIGKRNIDCDYIGFDQYEQHIDFKKIMDNPGFDVYYNKVMRDKNLYNQFIKFHSKEDIDNIISILNEIYGVNNKYSVALKSNHKNFYYESCFLMKKNIFIDFCKFLYDILSKLDERYCLNKMPDRYKIFFSNKSRKYGYDYLKRPGYQDRAFGFLAERLLSIFISENYENDVFVLNGKTNHSTVKYSNAQINNTISPNTDNINNIAKKNITINTNTKIRKSNSLTNKKRRILGAGFSMY